MSENDRPGRAPAPTASTLIDHEELTGPGRVLYNPAHLAVPVGELAPSTPAQIDAAVRSAHRALPVWAGLTVAERSAYLLAAARAVQADEESTADLLTSEHGKVLWESRFDVISSHHTLSDYAKRANTELDDVDIRDARGEFVVMRKPVGVTAVIIPWNFPVYLGLLMATPALLAGNTVVAKPSELAPLAVSKALTQISRALPPGVLNIVQGDGREAGAALAAHPAVRKINFTGSVATGRELMRIASAQLKRISFELGGNDPALILPGTPLREGLLDEMVRGTYTSTGQICYNIKRIYVHRDDYDAFGDAFTETANRIVVGDGFDPRSTIGPLSNRQQFDKVTDLLRDTVNSGARVREVGSRLTPDDWNDGLFMLPSVVTDVAPDARVVTEEQFGPVVPVIPYDSVDDAVTLINDSEYGLAASVWSDDTDDASHVARRIDAGTVFVNVHRIGAGASDMPFGGMKQSGYGRDSVTDALRENTEPQVISRRVDLGSFPGPDRFNRGADR